MGRLGRGRFVDGVLWLILRPSRVLAPPGGIPFARGSAPSYPWPCRLAAVRAAFLTIGGAKCIPWCCMSVGSMMAGDWALMVLIVPRRPRSKDRISAAGLTATTWTRPAGWAMPAASTKRRGYIVAEDLLEKAGRVVEAANRVGSTLWACRVSDVIVQLAREVERLRRKVAAYEHEPDLPFGGHRGSRNRHA